MFRTRNRLRLSKQGLINILNSYKNMCNTRMQEYGETNPFRMFNFPEDVSENIARMAIKVIEKQHCEWQVDGCTADLIKWDTSESLIEPVRKDIEVKCFMSGGANTFSRVAHWDEIYFVDARDFHNDNFGVYRIPISSDSPEWAYLIRNRNCERPKIRLQDIERDFPDLIIPIYDGPLKMLIENS
jgi:hypothetical protein